MSHQYRGPAFRCSFTKKGPTQDNSKSWSEYGPAFGTAFGPGRVYTKIQAGLKVGVNGVYVADKVVGQECRIENPNKIHSGSVT